MRDKTRVLGLNTEFDSLNYPNFTEAHFRSNISLLDYDMVIINASGIIDYYNEDKQGTYENKKLLCNEDSHQIKEDFMSICEQVVDLLNLGKNIYVLVGRNPNCFVYTGEKKSSTSGIGQVSIVKEFNAFLFQPVALTVAFVDGTEMEICSHEPFATFFRETNELVHYQARFILPEGGKALLRIKGTDKVVSAVVEHEQGRILFLPTPYLRGDYRTDEFWQEYGTQYLDSLIALDKALSTDGEYELPSWTETFTILNENDLIKKIEKAKDRLEKAQKTLEKHEESLSDLQYYKRLLTGSGTVLEEAVKQVLSEIGFKILEAEKGRSDVIAKYKAIDVVAEIKGVTKSAAEKHSAQLEKWVSNFILKTERQPKALLIVNGFCETPLDERTEDVFPAQMLLYASSRNHILLSSVQLLCLYIETKNTPSIKEERIQELLSTVGIYARYKNPLEFIRKENAAEENNNA